MWMEESTIILLETLNIWGKGRGQGSDCHNIHTLLGHSDFIMSAILVMTNFLDTITLEGNNNNNNKNNSYYYYYCYYYY